MKDDDPQAPLIRKLGSIGPGGPRSSSEERSERKPSSEAGPQRRRFEHLVETLPGRVGVVRSRPIVAPMRVTDADGNDWGLTLRLDSVPASGVVAPKGGSVRLTTCWEGCTVTSRCIGGAPYVGWDLYLGEELVEKVRSVAATLGETIVFPGDGDVETLKERYLRLARIVGEHHEAWWDSVMARVERLDERLAKGLITGAEFATRKARILEDL